MITFDDQAALDKYVRGVAIAALQEHQAVAREAMERACEAGGVSPEGRKILQLMLATNHAVMVVSIKRLKLPKPVLIDDLPLGADAAATFASEAMAIADIVDPQGFRA